MSVIKTKQLPTQEKFGLEWSIRIGSKYAHACLCVSAKVSVEVLQFHLISRVYGVPIALKQQPPEKQSAQQYPLKRIY